MTEKKKIDYLIEDNQRLMSEIEEYKKNSNEALTQKMVQEIKNYVDINQKLYKEYEKINHLKWYGSILKIKYRLLVLKLKIKSKFEL